MQNISSAELIETFNHRSFYVTASTLHLQAQELPELKLEGVILTSPSKIPSELAKMFPDQLAAKIVDLLTSLKTLDAHLELQIVPNHKDALES